MTTVYFTRHGETEWNRQFRYQGNKDSKLTENGILGAELLSERMREIEIDYIISSPLQRTMHTAEIIKDSKNIEIVKNPGLMEINFGMFEGLRYDEIEKRWPNELKVIKQDPINNPYPSGESVIEFYNRVETAFKNLIEGYKGKKILIVTHGGTIKCMYSYIKNINISKDWISDIVSNCSLSCVKIDDKNNMKKLFYNDISHLEMGKATNL